MRARSLILVALLLAQTRAGAAPYRPTDDAQVLERVPAGSPSVAATRSVHAERPGDPTLAAALGRAYVERARREADPRFLGYAEAALAPFWASPHPLPAVVLLRATIRQSRHQFDEALEDLDRVLAQSPDAAQAWLTRATILRVQGRYAEALAACRQLGASFAGRLCGTAVEGLRGRLAPAYEALRSLAAEAAQRPPAERAWHAAEQAEAAERLGRVGEAETIYRNALRDFPDDWQLRAAFADLLIDIGRAADAASISAGFERIDALLLRQLLARHALRSGDAQLQTRVADGFAAARRRGEGLHLREEARYTLEILGDAPRALELARQNWSVQREPWDARLLLAAARAAGQEQAAEPVRDWLAVTGFEDARINAPRASDVR